MTWPIALAIIASTIPTICWILYDAIRWHHQTERRLATLERNQ